MSEKRKHPRIRCQFFTELREDESNNSIGVGEIFDLSSGGAGLESHIPFITGQKAYIRFLLDGESINLFIEIIHIEEKIRRKFYGVKFIDATQEIIDIINKFVEKHSDKKSKIKRWDFMSKKKYSVAVIPGDGTGPEVVEEGIKALNAAANKFDFEIDYVNYDLGGERYKKTGEILPDSVIEELKKFKAIYLGAIGHPEVKPGILEKGLLLRLRFELDQYINLRPVKLFPNVDCPLRGKEPKDIDFVVVRENTEGLYAGAGGFLKKGTKDEVAIQTSVNTKKGVERCLRFAFEYTKKRNNRNQLTLCGKTNVLTYAFDLWERTFYEVAKEYPTIKTDYAHVDAITMWFVKNPEWFDVIVTDNMFGDIITDLGAMIQGGMGIAAGGNLNPEGTSMFEPIGGSAPKYTGKNVINPLAAICAAGMLLEFIGEEKAGHAVEAAVIKALSSGKIKSLAAGKMGLTTTQVGDLIASLV